MIPYSQMCNVCNACNARIAAVNFLRKVSIFSGKVAKRNSAKYKPPGNLIEDCRQRGQSNGDSIGSYPVLPTNNTRIAANCCDITTSEQQGAQRRSSELSERYKQCSNVLAFMSERYKRYKRYTF